MFPQTVWGSVRCSVNGAAMMTPRTLEETCYTQVPIHCGHCYTTQEMLPYRVPSEKVLSLGRPGWPVFACSPAGTLSCWSPAGCMKPLYSSTPSGHCSGWGEPCVPHRLDPEMTVCPLQMGPRDDWQGELASWPCGAGGGSVGTGLVASAAPSREKLMRGSPS